MAFTGDRERRLPVFSALCPRPNLTLAHQLLKDPDNFDFLTLSADAHERELESRWTRLGSGKRRAPWIFGVTEGGKEEEPKLPHFHCGALLRPVVEVLDHDPRACGLAAGGKYLCAFEIEDVHAVSAAERLQIFVHL